jgi:hypothetical protein
MPKTAVSLCLALLLVAALDARYDPELKSKTPKPREIVAKGLLVATGIYDTPTTIASERHLAKLVTIKETRDAILKQVDFTKEKLLLFSWSGTVGDRLKPLPGKAIEANFEFTIGGAESRAYALPLLQNTVTMQDFFEKSGVESRRVALLGDA